MTDELTLGALLIAAAVTGAVHTVAGPDHYLPFIVISRSRHYGMCRSMFWTAMCGVGHVGSAILLAAGFMLFAGLLSRSRLEWIEAWRGDIAAYALIGMGAAILLHALHRRWRGKLHRHTHTHSDGTVYEHGHALEGIQHSHANGDKSTCWVIFIIFVFGPCEALLPLLTASAALGAGSVVAVALVFSTVTILTMLTVVALGLGGLRIFKFDWLERYASELAGGTVICCGLAIAVLGL